MYICETNLNNAILKSSIIRTKENKKIKIIE